MNKADVLHVVPSVGLLAQSLFEQRDCQIRTAGPARIGLGEKNRAEPVRDVEPRIERRRQVQKRVQEIVSAAKGWNIRARIGPGGVRLGFDHTLRAAVILDRADPIEVGRESLVGDGEPARHPARFQIQRLIVDGSERKRGLTHALKRDRERHQERDERQHPDQTDGLAVSHVI